MRDRQSAAGAVTDEDGIIDHDDAAVSREDVHLIPKTINAANTTTSRREDALSLFEALHQYSGAVGWSIFFSLGIIMLAFDPQLIGQLYASPAFQRDFGYLYHGRYMISAPWQTALGLGNPLGQVFGAFFAPWPLEAYGRKKTFGACVVVTSCLISIQFFARSLRILLIGELLSGLVLGTYAVIAPAYASEVCPIALRGVLTSWINVCFVIGQLLANCVVAASSRLDSHWAYSIPFAVQGIWPLVILVGWPFAPESPWWLVRKGRTSEAEKALNRLAAKGVDVKKILLDIIETDRLERKLEAGSTYWDCLKGSNLRRTEIAVGVYSIQVISGVYLVGYATYFFELAGLPVEQAFNMGIGFLAVGLLGTFLSWILLVHFGRREIYCLGLTSLVILLLLIGLLDCIPNLDQHKSIVWSQASLMQVWNFCYDLSVGPICFVILCEVSAMNVRSKTIAIATAVQAVLGIIMTIAIPYLINADQADLRGKIGFFFGGLSLLGLVWAFLRIPETNGRSYEELDVMFAKGIATSEFKHYRVQEHDL